MSYIVADTSALISVAIVVDADPNPLDVLLDAHEVILPEQVVGELTETASYDDTSSVAAQAVLNRRSRFAVSTVELDDTFPLDDGENAAVTLANETNAVQLLCDEFNQLGLIHASLVDTRLVTTPILLVALVRNDVLPPETAENLLAKMSDARSWSANAYVARAKSTLRRERETSQKSG